MSESGCALLPSERRIARNGEYGLQGSVAGTVSPRRKVRTQAFAMLPATARHGVPGSNKASPDLWGSEGHVAGHFFYNGFDSVVSQFGLMFFRDRATAQAGDVTQKTLGFAPK
jgi:hypothetical protein